MRDYLTIGPTPAEEECEQIGSPNYSASKAKIESQVFINQIRRTLGEEPFGAALRVKSFPHDFGTYTEVVCYFEDSNEKATEYAFKCESESPGFWDEEAKRELRERLSQSTGIASNIFTFGKCLEAKRSK